MISTKSNGVTAAGRASRMAGFGCALVGFATVAALPVGAQGPTDEITITVRSVAGVDKLDAFSKADFYARATIDGTVVSSPRVRQQNEIRPNWKLTRAVPRGKRNIKLEIYDKDAVIDDPIDINRIDKKRSLEFVVDTRTCRIEGFAQSYRCGSRIVRAGTERKSARIVFSVEVKKR